MRISGIPQLQRRLKAISEQEQLLRQLQLATIAEAKALVPRRTGDLARSIIPGPRTRTFAEVIAQKHYAPFVEFGTRAHTIRPKKAGVLAWPADSKGRRLSGRPSAKTTRSGAFRYAKVVRHPGTKPQPFLLPAGEKALRDVGIQSIIKPWNDAA